MSRVYAVEARLPLLMVHGLLHLLGYDHETPADWAEMTQKETEVLEALRDDPDFHIKEDLGGVEASRAGELLHDKNTWTEMINANKVFEKAQLALRRQIASELKDEDDEDDEQNVAAGSSTVRSPQEGNPRGKRSNIAIRTQRKL